MGLGSIDKVNLRQARERARRCRELVEQGIDPIDRRHSERALTAARTAMTFRKAALVYIDGHKDGWTELYTRQWRVHFETYVFPKIGALPMQAVNNTEIVLRVLEPIWKTRPVTASLLRARIETVINWAKLHRYCAGDNAARWKGHLEHHLSPPERIRAVRHHPALRYSEMPGFLRKLRRHRGTAAVALEFTLFTVGRSGQTRWARWSEFDLDTGSWTIPAQRMKRRREHRVPLNEPALAILREVAWLKRSDDEFVFPGIKPGKPIGHHVMKTLMNYMGYNAIASTHGFRSSFKDWATEQTAFPTGAIELALAHAVRNPAYQRGDFLEKRRLLSKAWGDFCLGLTPLAASNLIPFPAPVSRNRAATAATSPQKGGRRLPPAAQLAFDL